jgi:hypothetical protein
MPKKGTISNPSTPTATAAAEPHPNGRSVAPVWQQSLASP